MPYSEEFMQYVADQASDAGAVAYRLMFGAYCVYLDGKPIGIVGDGQFFVKQTEAGKAMIPGMMSQPPYEGASPHFVVDFIDDRELLCRFLRATAGELPAPKMRKRQK